jgi:hypothetical protein
VPKIHCAIARGIRIPLGSGETTSSKMHVYFARIQVDLNLIDFLPNILLVEREEYNFNVDVE